MKTLGRIIMFIVGGVMLYLSISSIVTNYQIIQTNGWENFFTMDVFKAAVAIVSQAFNALLGLYAIYIGLRGKASFFAFIDAAILVIIVIFQTISFVNSGTEKNFQNIFNLVLGFLTPIGFAVGVVLLTFEKNSSTNN